MPNQKPPTQLDDCIFQAANHSLSIDKAIAELAALRAENARFLCTLQEISKGEGAYSRDPLEHAANCIDNMKIMAKKAIAGKKEIDHGRRHAKA